LQNQKKSSTISFNTAHVHSNLWRSPIREIVIDKTECVFSQLENRKNTTILCFTACEAEWYYRKVRLSADDSHRGVRKCALKRWDHGTL